MKLYLSAPITGHDIRHVEAAFAEAEEIIKNALPEHTIVNPLRIGTSVKLSWADNMIICLRELATCDAIIMLPGHTDSNGCKTELAFAKGCGITIFHSLSDFLNHNFPISVH